MTCFRLPNGKSVRQWCFKHNASYSAYWRCIEIGMPDKEALKYAKTAKHNFSHPTHCYEGKAVIKLCGDDSRRYFRVLRKIRNGIPTEQALKYEGVI